MARSIPQLRPLVSKELANRTSPFEAPPKIVVRETSERITAALDQQQFYLLSTLYSVYYRADYVGGESLYFLLALLNSRLCQFYMDNLVFNLSSGAFIKARANHYARFPLPPQQHADVRPRRDLDVLQFTSLNERGQYSAVLEEVEAQLLTSDLGSASQGVSDASGTRVAFDSAHDFLSYLAEQMIAMHKEKQGRVAAFWDDLAAAAPGTISEALRSKGKHERSLAAEPACRPYVDAESGSTRTLDESLAWERAAFEAFVGLLAGRGAVTAPLSRVYDKRTGYKALVTRIQETDDLIDQIVYRLYGLTEEEIAVVEGRASG